jgi:RNA polymerase sigma-70 factor, ECF subfamily
MRSLDDEQLKQMVEKFIGAWERADIDAVVSMLAEDAVLTMPPRPVWFVGRDAIRELFAAYPLAPGAPPIRLIQTRSNGQIAFGHYVWDEQENAFMPHSITVLALREIEIADFTIFRSPEAFVGFDLPERISQ